MAFIILEDPDRRTNLQGFYNEYNKYLMPLYLGIKQSVFESIQLFVLCNETVNELFNMVTTKVL